MTSHKKTNIATQPCNRALGVVLGLVLLMSGCVAGGEPPQIFVPPPSPQPQTSPLTAPTAAVSPAVAATDAPTQSLAAVSPLGPSGCITLEQFEASVGNSVCVAETIVASENQTNDFIMWLDQNPASRYIVVHNTFYLGVEGSCLRVTGVVQKDDQGRFFIRADDPGQVEPCQQ